MRFFYLYSVSMPYFFEPLRMQTLPLFHGIFCQQRSHLPKNNKNDKPQKKLQRKNRSISSTIISTAWVAGIK